MTVGADADSVRAWVREHHPEVRVMGYGRVMEVYKEMGRTADVVGKYGVAEMEGSPRGGPYTHGHRKRRDDDPFPSVHRGCRYVPGPTTGR